MHEVRNYPSIHLRDPSVGFSPAANTIETYVQGYDDRPTPDVNCTTTITDQLVARSQAPDIPTFAPERSED
jgi:hypothetical protein